MFRRVLIVLALCGFILAPALTWWVVKVEPIRRQHRIIKRLEKKFAIEFGQDSYRWFGLGNIAYVNVKYTDSATFGAEELALLARLPHLRHLHLGDVSCRTEGMENVEPLEQVQTLAWYIAKHLDDATLLALVSTMPSLDELALGACPKITEPGLVAVLKAKPELTILRLDPAPVLTEAGFRAVADHPGITSLHLGMLDGTDEQWTSLAPLEHSKLTELEIHGSLIFDAASGRFADPRIDDAVLLRLAVPATLKRIIFCDCAVTEDGLKAFRAAHPGVDAKTDTGLR